MSLAEVLASVQKSFDFRKEVTIGNIPFELSLLSLYEEQKISSLSTEGQDPLQYVADLKKQLLSYSIKKIKGEDIPDNVNSIIDGKEISEERSFYVKRFLDKMPGNISDTLFDVYVDLKDESTQNFKSSMKYAWFKTPEVREVEAREEAKKTEEQNIKKSEKIAKDGVAEGKEEDINLKPIPKTEEPEDKK